MTTLDDSRPGTTQVDVVVALLLSVPTSGAMEVRRTGSLASEKDQHPCYQKIRVRASRDADEHVVDTL